MPTIFFSMSFHSHCARILIYFSSWLSNVTQSDTKTKTKFNFNSGHKSHANLSSYTLHSYVFFFIQFQEDINNSNAATKK